jgi:hypothetical protein
MAVAMMIRNELEPIPTDWSLPGGGLYFVTPTARGKVSALAGLRMLTAWRRRQLR